MKPVDQTTFAEKGNCFSACIASILELTIDEVPYFMGPVVDGKGWWERCSEWCDSHGVRIQYQPDIDKIPYGYYIHTGRSPRNPHRYHAVVALNGELAHDPHVGDRRGVTDVLDYVTVEWIK